MRKTLIDIGIAFALVLLCMAISMTVAIIFALALNIAPHVPYATSMTGFLFMVIYLIVANGNFKKEEDND